jgi:hypothetical protein
VTNLTFYFRQAFNVVNPAVYTNLLLHLQRDDGAVVYLNGTEVFRSNMPLGPVNYDTLAATTTPDDGKNVFASAVKPALLTSGLNLLAVEVHQATTNSSDITFDLELLGNAPLSLIPLISQGAAWKYLDDGSDPGTAWVAPTFDDSGWSNGVAQLGFGEADEATQIRQFSTLTGTNAIAYYFRHAFEVTEPASITDLVVRLVRDDGGIVYLNGTEVFRINMPAGPVTSTTFASQVIVTDNSFHSAHINPRLLVRGNNVVAVEIHQFTLTSSDISFDLELRPNFPLTPPVVAITAPVNGANLIGPTNLSIEVLASDQDNAIASVAFYVSDNLRGTDSTDSYDLESYNYSLVVSNLEAGAYVLRAVGTDIGGLVTTSAPVRISIALATTLIPTNDVWKYSDTGMNWGTAWTESNFDDHAWATGRGKFGTNDPGMNTILHIRYPNGSIIPTAYFRHSFVVSNASSYSNLAFHVLRDDGVIAHLNGAEIFRMNMPAGPVTFNTYVPTIQAVGGDDESTYYRTNITTGTIWNGTNILAVELHQTINTGDASFDLELVGLATPVSIRPPLTVRYTRPTVTITWPGTGFTLQDSATVNGPYIDRPTATSPYVTSATTGNRFFRLIKP